MCQLTTQANEFLIRHFLRHRGKLDTLQLSIEVKQDCLIPETFITRIKKISFAKIGNAENQNKITVDVFFLVWEIRIWHH